jgi:hypothetical protein
MEYGDKTFKDEKLFLYQGFDPANVNNTNRLPLPSLEGAINQRDADILFMWKRVKFQLFLLFQLTQLFPEYSLLLVATCRSSTCCAKQCILLCFDS